MKLSGVMPALVTPFHAEGKIDYDAFERHLTMLRAAGVSGWVPCGSSGEYNLMSDNERDQVLQFVRDFAAPGEILIAGTNAPHTAGVIANTLRAKAMGYHAVLLATPFYTKPTQAELIAHFCAVLDATDNLPARFCCGHHWRSVQHLMSWRRCTALKTAIGATSPASSELTSSPV